METASFSFIRLEIHGLVVKDCAGAMSETFVTVGC